jgi:hypothetical protein
MRIQGKPVFAAAMPSLRDALKERSVRYRIERQSGFREELPAAGIWLESVAS